jgi:hypothetical protein
MRLPCRELLSNGKNETTEYIMTNDLVGGHYILQNTHMHGRLVLWTLPDLPLIWRKIMNPKILVFHKFLLYKWEEGLQYWPSPNITLDTVHNFTMISVNSSDE